MRGFGLVELVVTLVLVLMMAGGAAIYYRETTVASQLSTAQEELVRLRDEIHRWVLVPGRKVPNTVADLKRMDEAGTGDPWGSDYVIQPGRHRIVCAGPNRMLETPEGSPVARGDDLAIEFRPPVGAVLPEPAPDRLQLTVKQPAEWLPGRADDVVFTAISPVEQLTRITLEHVAGPDFPRVSFAVGGTRVTTSVGFKLCEEGTYALRATAFDAANNVAEVPVSIVVRCHASPMIELRIFGPNQLAPLQAGSYVVHAISSCRVLSEMGFDAGGSTQMTPVGGNRTQKQFGVAFTPDPQGKPRVVDVTAWAKDLCGGEGRTTIQVRIVP